MATIKVIKTEKKEKPNLVQYNKIKKHLKGLGSNDYVQVTYSDVEDNAFDFDNAFDLLKKDGYIIKSSSEYSGQQGMRGETKYTVNIFGAPLKIVTCSRCYGHGTVDTCFGGMDGVESCPRCDGTGKETK